MGYPAADQRGKIASGVAERLWPCRFLAGCTHSPLMLHLTFELWAVPCCWCTCICSSTGQCMGMQLLSAVV